MVANSDEKARPRDHCGQTKYALVRLDKESGFHPILYGKHLEVEADSGTIGLCLKGPLWLPGREWQGRSQG